LFLAWLEQQVECKGPGLTNDKYILNESHTDIHRFLFVNLNIRYLCKQFTAQDILTELDRLQTAQTTDQSMNDSMDPTYDRIMEAIRNQPMACTSRAIQTLACLVTAQRIMTIKELQIAVALKTGMTKLGPQDLPDEEKLVDSCFGLVVLGDNTKDVRLAHFTAQDHLNRKKIISQKSDTTLASHVQHICPSMSLRNLIAPRVMVTSSSVIHTVSLNTPSQTYHFT
jgi:hypothetical protein